MSSNLAMLGFFMEKKMSLNEYQHKVKERLEKSVTKILAEKIEKVELHGKGYINFWFNSLQHLGEEQKK